MTKQLFEEALADVKKVKQVAEENALRALTDAVTPRIRDFIDRVILQEHFGDEVDELASTSDLTGDVIVDVGVPGEEHAAGGITPPDAEGKVTLDIDSMCANGVTTNAPGPAVPAPMFGEPAPRPDEAEYEISLESLDSLKPILSAAKKVPMDVERVMGKLTERVKLLNQAGHVVKATPAYRKQIAQMISRVEDMYDHVQESVTDPVVKSSYETTLESSFQVLNTLQESTTMSQKTKKGQRIDEADLTLKLTGLPDEVEDTLDSVGVDLITGEEDEEGLEGGDQGGDQGGEEADLGGLDMGAQQGPDEDEGAQMESRKLTDDTIVEIDEKMLRREIAKLRSLREAHSGTGGSETKHDSWGNGPGGSDILDDFGGGKDEGDAVDQEITDLSPAKAARPLGESDDQDMDEGQDQMDEGDDDDLDEGDQDDLDEGDQDMDQGVHAPQDMAVHEGDMAQLQNRRKGDEYGTGVSDGHETATWSKRRHEGIRRLNFEKKLQERAQARSTALKKEAAVARAKKNAKRLREITKEHAVVAKRFNESLARSKKMSLIVANATKKLNEARSNSAATRPAEDKAVGTLRKKLAETNLFNAKLLYTNKLLRAEQLTSRQKAQVTKQLEEAKTVREVTLLYESLIKTLAGPSKAPLREGNDRQVMGSASRATRPASTQALNEGYETERWAQLAGITKR